MPLTADFIQRADIRMRGEGVGEDGMAVEDAEDALGIAGKWRGRGIFDQLRLFKDADDIAAVFGGEGGGEA